MHPGTTRALRPALAGALLAGGAWAGCAGAGTPSAAPSPVAAEECVLHAGAAAPRREVVVAPGEGGGSMDLARLRIDTPVRLDCLARPRPGLASTWSPDSSGRAWTLTLENAGAMAVTWRGRPEAAAALRFGGVESVVPLDDKRLVVTFHTAHDSLPALFADPALGLPRDSLPGPVLRLLPPGDARDAMDRGADVVRTADPAALDYAATHPELATLPLPWDRTYALVLPAASSGFGPSAGAEVAEFRAALAHDAVRVEARAAEAPFWWEAQSCTGQGTPRSPGPARSRAVLHLRSDPVARALAERLVATWATPGAVVRGVESAALTSALRYGNDLGYVVALPRHALVPCREIAAWPPGATAMALVDTRARLILRDGVPPLEVEYDGAIRPVPSP